MSFNKPQQERSSVVVNIVKPSSAVVLDLYTVICLLVMLWFLLLWFPTLQPRFGYPALPLIPCTCANQNNRADIATPVYHSRNRGGLCMKPTLEHCLPTAFADPCGRYVDVLALSLLISAPWCSYLAWLHFLVRAGFHFPNPGPCAGKLELNSAWIFTFNFLAIVPLAGGLASAIQVCLETRGLIFIFVCDQTVVRRLWASATLD